MADFRTAILNAHLEASKLHRDFHSRNRAATGRIDVFEMLDLSNIPVLFRPLQGLLGAYLDKPASGVMITTKRPLSVQRFTAAHELGHAILGHQSSVDHEDILTRAYRTSKNSVEFDQREYEANAFASALLTPAWLIAHHMRVQNWQPVDFQNPIRVYQLALRVGSSYAATCYALINEQVVSAELGSELLSISPKSVKSKILPLQFHPKNWYGDIWLLTMADKGLTIEGGVSDFVVFQLEEHPASGYIWEFQDLVTNGFDLLGETQDDRLTGDEVGGPLTRTIVTSATNRPRGHVLMTEKRPWELDGTALNELSLDVDMSAPVGAGLLLRQREAMLNVAS